MKNSLLNMFVALFLVLLVGCSVTGSLDGGNAGDTEAPVGNSPTDPPDGGDTGAVLDRGRTLFSSLQMTDSESVASASCAQCHEADGSGGRSASIRGLDATVLQDHAQGDTNHPALSGGRPGRVPEVKFPELDAADFEAIAAFLADN